jgi:NADPH:quinone reductase-like Zn-dependent oxidoreductase
VDNSKKFDMLRSIGADLVIDKLVPVIDRCYLLNDVVEAFRYFEEGHPQGKIVITVGHSSER